MCVCDPAVLVVLGSRQEKIFYTDKKKEGKCVDLWRRDAKKRAGKRVSSGPKIGKLNLNDYYHAKTIASINQCPSIDRRY